MLRSNRMFFLSYFYQYMYNLPFFLLRLKSVNPAKQEQARLEVENAEDDLVQKTEVAITLMKTVLENVSPLPYCFYPYLTIILGVAWTYQEPQRACQSPAYLFIIRSRGSFCCSRGDWGTQCSRWRWIQVRWIFLSFFTSPLIFYCLGSPATTEIPLNWATDSDRRWEMLNFVRMKAEDELNFLLPQFFLCFHVRFNPLFFYSAKLSHLNSPPFNEIKRPMNLFFRLSAHDSFRRAKWFLHSCEFLCVCRLTDDNGWVCLLSF